MCRFKVHYVDAEIAGANFADERIHVCAIHVKQATLGVKNVGNLVDFLLEHAKSIRIREHERGDIFIHLRFQRGDVDHAARIRFQIFDRVVDHGGGCGIGSMGGIRNQNFFPRVVPRHGGKRAP